jgi:uroporphyrinogen-III synthase
VLLALAGNQADPAPLLLKHWEAGTLDAVTLTSSEGLRYFFDMVGHLGQAWLKKTPVFVTHQRIAAQASGAGSATDYSHRPRGRWFDSRTHAILRTSWNMKITLY